MNKTTLLIDTESDTSVALMPGIYEPAGGEFQYYGNTYQVEDIKDVFENSLGSHSFVRKIYAKPKR